MAKDYNYIAFFDLDGTLLKVNSGKVLIRRAHQSGLMHTRDLMHAFYLSFLHKFNLKETTQIAAQMPKWMGGMPEQEMADFSEKIIKRELLNLIRPEMYEEIETHKKNNARLVMLSASLPYICGPIARHLEFDDIICSRLETIDGVLTGNPIGRLCLDDEKLVRFNDYCGLHNCSISDAYYYGDSIEDFPVLDVVGHPVCIKPDKKLNKIAIQKGWPIHNWV